MIQQDAFETPQTHQGNNMIKLYVNIRMKFIEYVQMSYEMILLQINDNITDEQNPVFRGQKMCTYMYMYCYATYGV